MPAIVTELFDGQALERTADGQSYRRKWLVTGVASMGAAEAATGITIGASLGSGEIMTCSKLRTTPMTEEKYEVEATYEYSVNRRDPAEHADGDEEWDLDLTAQNVRQQHCIDQVSYGSQPRDVGKLVGVTDDGKVEGFDGLAPHGQLIVRQWKNRTELTEEFVSDVFALERHVNSAAFYGFAAGELLFHGMRTAKTGATLATLEFVFEISPNVAGGSTNEIPAFIDYANGEEFNIDNGKKGWEYLWLDQKDRNVDDGSGGGPRLQIAVRGAYVAQVYPTSNYSALGLSGTL